MLKFVRQDAKGQIYFHCSKNEYHDYYKRTCTIDSYFYCRKVEFHIQLAVIRDYFRLAVQTSILSCRQISQVALTTITRDCALMMSSDFTRRYFDNGFRMGDSPGCHHLQMDESKFGKRKYNNGRRVEGCWVFGVVEAISTDTPNVYKAGQIFACTVPNRTAYTLLPIIYRVCRRDTIIRSDGWAAYNSLHPRDADCIVSTGVNAEGQSTVVYSNREAYRNGNYFFRQHQVINHSVAYSGRDMVLGNNTVEDINTNMIEGVWTQMKDKINRRNYNEKDLPGKLMEHIWRRVNRDHIQDGMERCLREVSFDASIRDREEGDNDEGIMTRGVNGNPPEVEAAYQARVAARRANDLLRYRARRRRNNIETQADVARANRGREYERSLDDPISLPVDSSSSESEEDFDFADSDDDYSNLPDSFPPPPSPSTGSSSTPPPPSTSPRSPTPSSQNPPSSLHFSSTSTSSSPPLQPTTTSSPSSTTTTTSSAQETSSGQVVGRPRGRRNTPRTRGRGRSLNTTARTRISRRR